MLKTTRVFLTSLGVLALTTGLSGCLNGLTSTDGNGSTTGRPPGPIAPNDPGHPDTLPARPGVGGDGDKPDIPPPEPEPEVPAEPTMMESTKNDLAWKRVRAVEQDLMRGLELSKNEVCDELGTFRCTDVVHLSPLGGNEPFNSGQYRPSPSPTATTALALSRVVLSACAQRVRQDKTGTPAVFSDIELDGGALDNDDAATLEAVDATTVSLFQRLLSRDPTDDEKTTVRGLLAEGDGAGAINGEEFATLACYVVGTTAENIFF